MGNILSRFKSLESTKETLARIHSEIEEIEDYKWITLRNQNHIIGFYIFGLSIVYAFIIISVYFYYMQRLKNRGVIASVLYVVTFPFLAYILRNFLKSYYQHKLAVQEDRLHELKRSKRKILDEIMEKETYKVAKELIEKYDPSMLKEKISPESQLDLSMRMNQSMNSSILRQRATPSVNPMNQTAMAALGNRRLPPMGTPKQPPSLLAIQQSSQMKAPMQPPPSSSSINPSINRPPQPFNPAMMRTPLARPNLVRPICSQDRSIVEKMVDYLVGDGPNNRYGLICKFCYSHNGMALKEEFDYLNFRCCFCNNLNMARKQKPIAPTLVSYESVKDSNADETLNESIKKFKLEDDSSDSKNTSSTQIEEIEHKLNATKLDEEETTKSSEDDDEMQVDDDSSSSKTSSKENTQELKQDNLQSKEQLNQQLDELKLSE